MLCGQRWKGKPAAEVVHPVHTHPADFEKDYSAEVLDLMGSMLGFTPDDRAKIAESRRRQGWRDISLASDATLAHGGGGGAAAKASLADSWVDFLEHQMQADAADAAGGGGGSAGGGGGTPTHPQAQGLAPVAL